MEHEEENKTHLKYVLMAVEQSKLATESGKGEPFGSLIVQNGEVIAIDHNRLYADCDPTAHAEMVVIRKACKAQSTIVLKNSTLYSSAQPCPMCMTAVRMSGIEKVYYSVSGPQVGEAFARITDFPALGLHPKQELYREVPLEQINSPQGLEALNAYFDSKINKKE